MKIVFWAGLIVSFVVLFLSANELLRVFDNAPYYASFQSNPFPAYVFLFIYSVFAPVVGYAMMRQRALRIAAAFSLSSPIVLMLVVTSVPNGILRV